MLKKTIIFFFFCLMAFNIYAVEITSVSRDFAYPNIFIYKAELIGRATVNKFGFGHDVVDEERPEYFLIKLKTKKEMIGAKIKIIFEYKSQHSKEFKSSTKEITIRKKTEKVEFYFSGPSNKVNGRVEVWRIKALDQHGNFLAEKSSPSNKWRN